MEFFKKYRRTVVSVSVVFVVTLLLHAISKPFYILSWHYIRNIFMYVALIPISAVLLKNKKINVDLILSSFLLLNLVFSIAQLAWFRDSLLDGTRPLGVVGDPIIASLFNYFLVFKLIFEKLNIYKIGAIIIAFICLDAQASITALVCVALAVLISVCMDVPFYKKYFLKLVFFTGLFAGVTFFQISDNDLSFRITAVFYGTVGKYIGFIDTGRAETFRNLSRERIKIIEDNDLFSSEIRKSKDNFMDDDVFTMDDVRESYLVGEVSVMTLLFGDYYRAQYYKLDSNLVSIFKNLGLVSLLLYYFCIGYVIVSAIKLRNTESKKIIFFALSVLFLGLFCATIYKFPVMQIMYLYFGYLVVKSAVVKQKVHALKSIRRVRAS
jgi:hypothetical protein